MPTYYVTLPISGLVSVDIEADSQQDAIDKALAGLLPREPDQWEAHEYLVRGDVVYASPTQATAEEVE